jgi:hypothetical protein
MQKIQLLGQGLFQRLVDEQPNGYKGSLIGCKCGGYMKFVQQRHSHYFGLDNGQTCVLSLS